jgi:hypothetical protein
MKKFWVLSIVMAALFCGLMPLANAQQNSTVYTQSLGPVSNAGCTAAAGVNTSAAISPCGGQGGMYQNSLVTTHTLSWTAVATTSACTVELEQSSTGTGSWTLLGVQQTCTSSGSYTVTASAAYVRFNINSLTNTGSGSITINYFGQVNQAPLNVVSSVTNCGTATACSPSFNAGTFRVVYGQCTAAGATTCTVTAIAPPFTSATSYYCVASDGTTQANGAFKITYASSSSFVVTTTSSSDAFNWMCFGT